MRIALIVSPFISVPPERYGGTELFAAHLAMGLDRLGLEVVVYTNGESTVPVEKRWIYPKSQWPLSTEIHNNLRDVNHGAWAVRDAAESCDLIHLNNAPSLAYSRFVKLPFVYTLHHEHNTDLSRLYAHYPDAWYVSISDYQRSLESLKRIRTIHHGIEIANYQMGHGKRSYFTFLGRIAPVKGTHIAIEVAKRAGIPLKIAGEIQPMFRDYFDSEVKPHLDGQIVEYVGEADLATKNELLGGSLALLFPIQWNEPFGLVMIEAMACGTPVLAFPRGSVQEIVQDGLSGYICASPDEMVERAATADQFNSAAIRQYVKQQFSTESMAQRYAELYAEAIGKPLASSTTDLDHGDESRAIA